MIEPKPCTLIAIVDDDESLCRSLSRLLRASGFQPVTYRSAEDFLADANPGRFCCLILDIQLGGLSGIELSKRLAAAGSITPIIFLSAYDEPAPREQAALRTDSVAYLRKSDPGEAVLATLRRMTAMPAPAPLTAPGTEASR